MSSDRYVLKRRAKEMSHTPKNRLSAPRSCIAILGVPFDCVTMQDAVRLIEEMVESRRPHFLATANVDFVVQALEDDELRRILFDANLVVCDGTPLVWASRWLGNQLPERVAGSDLVPLLLRLAAKKNYGIYFLGGKPEVTARAIENIKRDYPGARVAGSDSPPFAPLHEMDHEAIASRIREAKPDILLVSFGCPKQEKWIAMKYRSLGVPVSIGVGATIDFLAGEMSRAPMWMRKAGLEWLFRLLQEPRRLFKRYVKDFWVFGWAIRRQVKQLGRPKPQPTPSAKSRRKPAPVEPDVMTLPDDLDAAFVASPAFDWEARAVETNYLFADAAKVRFVDSTGIGSLVRLQKRLRENDGRVILFNITAPLERALNLMKLSALLPVARNLNEARMMTAQFERDRSAPVKWGRTGAVAQIWWSGEVTVNTIDDLWQKTDETLIAREHEDAEVVVDLSAVTFIDSSGLGSMVRMRRTARQSGVELRFIRPSDVVKRVARIARLDEFLFGEKL